MSRHGLLLLASLLLAACAPTDEPASATAGTAPEGGKVASPAPADDNTAAAPALAPLGSYRPLELQLGSALDGEGRVRAAATVFARTDAVYLSVLGSAGDLPVRVKARWLDADERVLGESGQLLEPGPASVLTFSLKQPQGWPQGRYRVELALNDMPIDRREFEVR